MNTPRHHRSLRPTKTESKIPTVLSGSGPQNSDQHPLRTLWLIKGLGPGGAERLLVAAAGAHRSDAVELSCAYVLDQKFHLTRQLAANGVTVRPLRVSTALDPRWVLRLLRLLRHERFDVVHSHSPTVAVVARVLVWTRLAGWRRAGLITTEHNAWTTFHPVTRLACRATSWMDDASISVSGETRRSLEPRRLRERSETIIHGIDLVATRQALADRGEIRRQLGIDGEALVVTTVANYRAQKNYPNLLRAAAAVLADPDLAHLYVLFVAVGQGPLAGEIESLHAGLALGARFRLLGYRPDAVDVLAGSDVFVLASDYEGLPVALMEALALGLPIVATAVGGVGEVVTPDAGNLVEPDDSGALAAALVDMLKESARRTSASTAAGALAGQFDVGRTVRRIEEIYRRIAGLPQLG